MADLVANTSMSPADSAVVEGIGVTHLHHRVRRS
jgi:hypothetical protein